MKYFCYHTLITNLDTGEAKHYFGQHKPNETKRSLEYKGSGRYVSNCIAKNKIEQRYVLERIIVREFETKKDTNEYEIKLIALGREQFGDACKNISKGGDGYDWTGRHHTEKACKKISESQIGRKPSEETKLKMSNSKKGNKCHMFGVSKTREIKQKISESLKGVMVKERNPMFKGYYSTPFGLLASSGEAKRYGIAPSTLRRWCNNKEGYSFIPA